MRSLVVMGIAALAFMSMTSADAQDRARKRITDWKAAASGCASLQASGLGGTLHKLSDSQLEQGLCLTSLTVVEAIADRQHKAEELCMGAAQQLASEFKKRFPRRDLKSVTGRC